MSRSFDELSALAKEMGFNTIPDTQLKQLLDIYNGDRSKVFEHLMNIPNDISQFHSMNKYIHGQDSYTNSSVVNSKPLVIGKTYDCVSSDQTNQQRTEMNSPQSPLPPSLDQTSNFREMKILHRQDGNAFINESFDLDRIPLQMGKSSINVMDAQLKSSFTFPGDQFYEEDNNFLNNTHKIQGPIVYFTSEASPDERKELDQIIELFQQEVVPYSQVDLAHDLEQLGLIIAKLNGKLQLPVVFLNSKLVGNYNDVEGLIGQIKYECAEQLVKSVTPEDYQYLNDVSNKNINLGMIDRALNVGEVVLSYLNPLSWFGNDHSKQNNIIGGSIEEFAVIQCNWYMRNQKRILRFGADFFLRLRPDTGEIRAVYRYSSLTEVLQLKDEKLILTYIDGHKDYFKAHKEVLSHIVALFMVRCGPSLKLEISTGPKNKNK